MDIITDLTAITLETPRLLLRAFEQEDLQDLYDYASVPGVGEMAGWAHHQSLAETQKVLDMFRAGGNVFALAERESGKVIGSLGLHPSPVEGTAYELLRCKEIGYVLSKAYWGRGLMPEAVKEVIRFCFEELNAELLTVGHYEGNMQSARVIEKCGFTFWRAYTSEKHGKKVFAYILKR